MVQIHVPSRLRLAEHAQALEPPSITNTPDLPVVDWNSFGQQAYTLEDSPGNQLPRADTIVITWAGAEWAALQHVFCDSQTPMPYSDRYESDWPGWIIDNTDLPHGGPSDWTAWGSFRLVGRGGNQVLLYKSNTHLDWPGPKYLTALTQRLITQVQPNLIVSTGTAGGTKPTDHIGTVRATHATTLYENGVPSSGWPTTFCSWAPDWQPLSLPTAENNFLPIPTVESDLDSLVDQLNESKHTDYSLADLDPAGLNYGDGEPDVYNDTASNEALLTTPTFVVGTLDGDYGSYSCIEMDDAILAAICQHQSIDFGSVRNISDPAQPVALPTEIQSGWGGAVYSAYGFYTSYNSALVTAAVI